MDISGSSTWAVFHCFIQAIIRELDWEQSSLDKNQNPYGMLMAHALFIMLQHQPLCFLKEGCSFAGQAMK